MRVPLGLGDSVSDGIVGVVKEFLDGVWRVHSSGHRWRGADLSRWLPQETSVPSTWCGEEGSGAMPWKSVMVGFW